MFYSMKIRHTKLTNNLYNEHRQNQFLMNLLKKQATF